MGRSERPATADGYAIGRVAADVLAVADELGFERFAVWGGSAGAAVGTVLAVEAPERVAALVAVGGWPVDDTVAEDAAQRGLAQLVRDVGDPAVIVRQLCDSEGLPSSHWMNEIGHGDAGVVADLVEGSRDYDWAGRGTPGRVGVPVLIVAGELEDAEGEAAVVAAAMPDARAVTLPGLGHVGLQVAAGETVAHARPFLLAHARD
jgi:pimeloyl-ACP methyl ester carboxylesterase